VNGVRSDGLFVGPIEKDLNWNGIWDTAGRIVDDGWIVEVEIPFKTLNIDPDTRLAFNLSAAMPPASSMAGRRAMAGPVSARRVP
jgi:hypothetical protein